MNTAKLIESIEADKFRESRILVNDRGETGVLLALDDSENNSCIEAGKYFYEITSIEVYDSYFTINYFWTKSQFIYNPTQEESGESSIDVDIERFGPVEEPIDRESMNEYYYYEIWQYLEAYVQPDY